MATYEIIYLASNGYRDFERVKANSIQDAMKWFISKFGGATVYSIEAVDVSLPEWSERHGGGKSLRVAGNANKSLIAAAPHLLAVLRDIGEYRGESPSAPYRRIVMDLGERARAAVAKAEGRSV